MNWEASRPAAFDIATCWFPESPEFDKPGLKLRPGLVLSVLQNQRTGAFLCTIAFGTKNLKIMQRGTIDLIIQNVQDLNQFRLGRATRFDLDHKVVLPWNSRFFGCWPGHQTPVLSQLTEEYVKQFAFCMMRRGSV